MNLPLEHSYWILDDDHNPVKVHDVLTWGRFFEDTSRGAVGKTQIGAAKVSTVFLGIDHNWGPGPPALFETMIFGGEHDQWQDRASTWKQAEEMHEQACALVRGNQQ